MGRRAVESWIEENLRCWREKDSDAVTKLFTDTASYRSSPFREPHRGAEAIRTYWTRATAPQVDFRVKVGTPICEGDHTSVEWWSTWTEAEEPVTLPGCLALRFESDSRCKELREYWHHDASIREPPDGWGV